MFNLKVDKGIALFMVLATILIIVILANVVLAIVSSQSRLTHHQIGRIQAYYAAQAGVNYALEKLRLGDANWIPSNDTIPNNITRTLCSGCVAPNVNEPDLPHSIKQVNITIEAKGTGWGGTRRISANATYTYP